MKITIDTSIRRAQKGATETGEFTVHIADKVDAQLIADGWDFDGEYYRREAVTGGQYGVQIQLLCMCKNGRWFERHDGWGRVEREVDLRNHSEAESAIAAALA